MINKRGKIAVGEILILVVAIFAFAWMISGEIRFVEGSLGLKVPSYFAEKTAIPKLGTISNKVPGFFEKAWAAKGTILKNYGIAATVYFGARWAAEKLGVDSKDAKTVAIATTAAQLGGKYAATHIIGEKTAEWWIFKDVAFGITPFTIGVFVVTTAVFWKDHKSKTVVFECKTWDAETGGSSCEECNKQGILPCSEYQCHALGQGCVLEEGKCFWKNEKDKDYPVIKLNPDSLLDDYKYTSKTETGVVIERKETECIKAFTPLTFGVSTNEVARCKMDMDRKKSFGDMQWTLGERNYNHTIALSLPTPNMTDTAVIQPGDDYKFYIKCMDGNGNENPVAFGFKFCVESGPDKESPSIITTSIPETSPYVGFDTEETEFTIGVNEPSQCKWDTQDKSYDDMINIMDCGEEEVEMNVQMLFECSTTLKSIEKGDNKFYFRCADRSENENKMKKSYEFILKRTSELLEIDESSISPTETMRGSTDLIVVELKLKTLKGANEGASKCYYGETDEYESGLMFETNSYEHMQELGLEEDDYKYYIKCVDAGGDEDTTTISFDVESDAGAPIVVRVYKDGNDLTIITNEKAECVYDKKGCDTLFEDGISMSTTDDLEHSTTWKVGSTYYIKCQDEYKNKPATGCSIIVKPTSF